MLALAAETVHDILFAHDEVPQEGLMSRRAKCKKCFVLRCFMACVAGECLRVRNKQHTTEM